MGALGLGWVTATKYCNVGKRCYCSMGHPTCDYDWRKPNLHLDASDNPSWPFHLLNFCGKWMNMGPMRVNVWQCSSSILFTFSSIEISPFCDQILCRWKFGEALEPHPGWCERWASPPPRKGQLFGRADDLHMATLWIIMYNMIYYTLL